MDGVVADEIEIERKLKDLESKRSSKFNLLDIKRPEDLSVLADKERESALRRNAQLLQEIDIQIAKLHTQRLCPFQKKLESLKEKTGFYPTIIPKSPKYQDPR